VGEKKELWTPGGMKQIAVGGDEKALKEVAKATEQWDPDPLADQVLLRKFPEEEMKTKGGIVLPDTARNKMILKGIVYAHGPGRRDAAGVLIPISVAEGDIVLASTYSTNTEIELNGEKFNLVREADLLLRFKRKAKPPEAPAATGAPGVTDAMSPGPQGPPAPAAEPVPAQASAP
jgi:chaperonin GroES